LESPKKLSFDHGAHVCHLFEDSNEQKALVLPFLLEGLRLGESCLYITGRQSIDDWYLELQAYGIDVQRERQREALEVVTGAEYRRPQGFTSTIRARELLEFIDDRLQDFPGVRIAGDVAWEWEPALPADKLCHWEATANLVFEDLEVITICQYDVSADSPALIHSALRTHPQVILRQQIYLNPFYEAPRILENEPHLNHSDADAQSIETMLSVIRAAPNLPLQS
jgi:hypothetical protein